MKPLHTIKRLKNLITQPIKEWAEIEKEKYSIKEIIYRFAFPIILFASITTYLGGSVIVELHSTQVSIIKALITFLSFSLSIYISAVVLNQLLPKFNTEKNLNSLLIVMIYAFSIFIITSGIADLHSYLNYINILGIYSLVLLWIGIKLVIKISADKVAGFAIIAFLFTIIIYTLINFVLSLFFLT